MKKSTKYAVLGAAGAISLVGGVTSLMVEGCNRDAAAQELQNKKDDLASKLVNCLEIGTNDCRAISSEYKSASDAYFGLKQKEFPYPWSPVVFMVGGYSLAYFGGSRFFRESLKERIKELREKYKITGDQ